MKKSALFIVTCVLYSGLSWGESLKGPAGVKSSVKHIEQTQHQLEVVFNDVEHSQYLLDQNRSNDCVSSCRYIGVKKVLNRALQMGVFVRATDVRACEVDNGWINDEVDFCANTSKGLIRVQTKRSFMQDCE